jgi:hypothetical protein
LQSRKLSLGCGRLEDHDVNHIETRANPILQSIGNPKTVIIKPIISNPKLVRQVKLFHGWDPPLPSMWLPAAGLCPAIQRFLNDNYACLVVN